MKNSKLNYLNLLNNIQKEATTYLDGPCLIVAELDQEKQKS